MVNILTLSNFMLCPFFLQNFHFFERSVTWLSLDIANFEEPQLNILKKTNEKKRSQGKANFVFITEYFYKDKIH